MPVTDFLAVRFTLALIVLVLVAGRQALRLPRRAARLGLLLGACYGLAQLLQTFGLARTPASVSGFLTGMYVVATPVLARVILRQRTTAVTWCAVALSTGALAALSLRGLSVGPGHLFLLAAAVLYALHILGLSAWSGADRALGLAVWQTLGIWLVCLLSAAPHGVDLPTSPRVWAVLVYTAVFAAALALLVQTWAQAHLGATRAAIIMTFEPVFTAFFAVALAGERPGPRTLVGGTLMVAAMLLIELVPSRSTPETAQGTAHPTPSRWRLPRTRTRRNGPTGPPVTPRAAATPRAARRAPRPRVRSPRRPGRGG